MSILDDLMGEYGFAVPKAAYDKLQEHIAARQQVGNAEQLDHALGQTIDQRDRYHEVADEMAAHIDRITGVEIGEHSSDNCPWQNAIEAAESYSPAQGIDLGPLRKLADEIEWAAGNNNADYHKSWAKRLRVGLALIDQRDAAPGVGHG